MQKAKGKEEIKIGSGDTYAMISSVGATVTRFVWRGIDVIFPQTEIDGKLRGGIPICFPFFGIVKGAPWKIPMHGWLRNQKLTISTTNPDKVVLWGFNEPSNDYPWLLSYEIIIQVCADFGLSLSLFASRTSEGAAGVAPVNPAFHPYFQKHPEGPIIFDHGGKLLSFKNEADKVPARKSVEFSTGKLSVRMTNGGAFSDDSSLVLWSDRPEKYFCVEPVLVDPKRFGDEKEFTLDQGQSLKMECLISVSQRNRRG